MTKEQLDKIIDLTFEAKLPKLKVEDLKYGDKKISEYALKDYEQNLSTFKEDLKDNLAIMLEIKEVKEND